MSKQKFSAKLYSINNTVVLRLPQNVSDTFPSRGMALADVEINGTAFLVVLEPDGKGAHWLEVDAKMQKEAKVQAGDTVTVTAEPSNDWPEPTVPADMKNALADASDDVRTLWKDITPMARWDWLRWIVGTKNPDTRAKRIMVACSKLADGERRPCCFNRSMCYNPRTSKNGVLIA